jgi:hypothetical protein
MLHLCLDQPIDAFADLYSIQSKDLFPRQLLLDEVWPSLYFIQRDLITESAFYKNSKDPIRQLDDSNTTATKTKFPQFMHQNLSCDLLMEDYELCEDLSLADFTAKLDTLEIRIDIETPDRLFNSLTLCQGTAVDFTTFEIFVDTYQAKDEDLQKVNKYLPINKLRTTEFALKVSNSTAVPNAGIGRIVLTQKCLYFLEQ